MSSPASPTKPCPECGKPMPANRGVCPNPDCTYASTWFKVRLYLGCAGVLIGLVLIAIMAWMAMHAPE